MTVKAPSRLPLLDNQEAWQRLPGAPPEAERLPGWARGLAGWQPVTTARMLELDALHRTGDRLDARLRAVARWAAADANRCEYAKAQAEVDYDRASGGASHLSEVMRSEDRLPEVDRRVAVFTRRLMLDAAGVTDDEVAGLLDLLGDERTVALVALVAHASFQDRLFLALGLNVERDGIPPPVTTGFARPRPVRPAPRPAPGVKWSPAREPDSWGRTRAGLERQMRRPGRIAVPTPEAVIARLGKDHPAIWQNGLVWSRVCFGHQPKLTEAWFDATAAFRQECDLDPVFATSLFWVVTDSLNCFY